MKLAGHHVVGILLASSTSSLMRIFM